MPPRRTDLRISAPLCNPELRTESSHGPNPYPPLSPILKSQRQTHASYPPMHSSLPFDGTERTSYHNRFASHHNPQSSATIAIGQSSTMHRRRASTLKSIMRKLFGRKHKSDLVAPDSGFHEKARTATPSQASMGIRASGNPFITVPETVQSSSKSSSSHGQNSFLPSPAEPTFVTISIPPQEHEEEEDDDPKPETPKRHRRRATLPSLVLSTEDGRELASRIAQEGSRNGSEPSSPLTRMTFDRPLRPTEKQLKRRSRSAYALRESAKAHRMSPIQWRRRSDEMKLWRVSVDRKTEAESIQERPETQSTAGGEEKDSTEIRVENFAPNNELGQLDFGNLVSNMQEDTEASLTQRVCTLEVKLMDLEFAIAKMQGSDVSPIQPFQPMTPIRPTNNNLDSGPSSATAPTSGFLRASTSHGAATPRTSPADITRPTSTATVRPHTAVAHSSPPLTPSSTSPGISVEQYSALTTLVRREQAARKNLENQVSQLQQEIQALRGALPGSSGPGQDSFLRASSADSSSIRSRHRPRHDRLDSGMWRQTSDSSGGKPETGSLDSHPVRADSPPHRKSAFDRMLGRT